MHTHVIMVVFAKICITKLHMNFSMLTNYVHDQKTIAKSPH